MNSRTELYAHQERAFRKLLPIRIGALFMEMGTGKSRTVIEIAIQRLHQNKLSKIIWFCPVMLKFTVMNELFKHTDCTTKDICLFDDKMRQKHIPQSIWYIVGTESMSISVRVIGCVDELIDNNSMIIVDESSYIKGHNSKRTERITFFGSRAKYRMILTGTPLSQGVVDLYAQMRFLSPKILGYNSFYSFAANHLEYDIKFKHRIVDAHNTDQLAEKIKPYVYQVTKDECLDLPEKIYTSYYFNMTIQQRDIYKYVKESLLCELSQDYNLDFATIFRLFTSLQQIVCGFCNNKFLHISGLQDSIITFEHERIGLLLNVIEGIPHNEKIIIWAKYRYDIDMIVGALTDSYDEDSIAQFHGGLNQKQKQSQIDKFRAKAKFFVSTISCGAHGLTLNEACYTIFYSNSFKYSERIQAEDRNHRIGQTRKVVYIDLVCNKSIDERIIESIEAKKDVLRDFKASVDRVKDDICEVEKCVDAL